MTANEARAMVKKYNEEKVEKNLKEAQKLREEMNIQIAEVASSGRDYFGFNVPAVYDIWVIVKESFLQDGFEVKLGSNDTFFVKW